MSFIINAMICDFLAVTGTNKTLNGELHIMNCLTPLVGLIHVGHCEESWAYEQLNKLVKKLSILERFSIECRKVITTANQKKGKYHKEPMRTQNKYMYCKWLQARESRNWFQFCI